MISAFEHFRPHHQELRTRLLRSILALVICSTVAYIFKEQITQLCMEPLFRAYPELEKLVYTKLTEAFISYIKISILTGCILSFPYLLYQLWMFISPGLLEDEKKTAFVIVFWATMLFVSGGLFAFFIALPQILKFFMHYAGSNLIPMPKFGLYLTFVGRMILTFSLAFEIPFLMVMVGKTGLVSSQYFRKKRLWFYLAILILAFMLTAGDITATVLLAVPLFFLYEAGILVGSILKKTNKRPAR
ncbi:twin-arginine translocase subunit TatC [Desulfogranum japonicum]|uniref:twin-arginine translocase subunit TatC n=1 Tax=Desulfogranum japonicum TaxID=231447 RepID=UPI000422ACD9|nr:twin-arginine translocase subunit TatC [Desulfogranum japonicum]